MRAKSLTVTVFAGLAIAASGAHAQTMNLVADDRILVGFGTAQFTDGTFDFDSQEATPGTPFQNWSDAAGAGAAAGGGSASVGSLISDTTIAATGDASADAYFDALEHDYVAALGSNAHTIAFEIAQTTTFLIAGQLDATGTAQAWVRVREGFFFGDLLFDRTTDAGPLSVGAQLTLDPGSYNVQFFANSNIVLTTDGSASGAASFDMVFAVIPAPGVLSIAPACLLVARRRR